MRGLRSLLGHNKANPALPEEHGGKKNASLTEAGPIAGTVPTGGGDFFDAF
jgi:hypothetical protein